MTDTYSMQRIRGSRRYDAILFDLDGTLLNTIGDLHAAVNYALRTYGQPERTLAEVTGFVGNGIRKLMERSVPQGADCPNFEEELRTFIDYYLSNVAVHTTFYEGIPKLLDLCAESGIGMAVVSNKIQSGVDELRERYLSKWIRYAYGDSPELRPRKPDPAIVGAALAALFDDEVYESGSARPDADIKDSIHRISAAHPILYVGDSLTDAATAENAGLPYVLCGWGFRPREELLYSHAEAVVDRPEELIDIIGIGL